MKQTHAAKALIAVAIALLLATNVQAQGRRHLQAFSAGAKVAAGLTDMHLTAECYEMYSHHPVPEGGFGGWLQWRSSQGITLRAEAMMHTPGAHLTWDDIDYQLREYALGLRLYFQVDIPVDYSFALFYIAAAPGLNSILGGDVRFTSDATGDVAMALNTSDTRSADLDLYIGLGAEMPLAAGSRSYPVAIEVGYHWGLRNSFSGIDMNELTVLNRTINTWPATGDRLRRGFELSVRIGIPFGGKVHIARRRPTARFSRRECGQ